MKTVPCPHCQQPLNAGDVLSQINRGTHRQFSEAHKAKLRAGLVLARARLAAKREERKKLDWLGK